MRANFVGRSVVSAMIQTPASGPFEPLTTPPISLARTSTLCCACKQVENAIASTEKMTAGSKRRSASTKCNMDYLPGIEPAAPPACHCGKSNKADRQRRANFASGNFSTGETAAVQKRLLLRRGRAPEDGVAMRKPAEAPDDVRVQFGPFQTVSVADCFIKSDTAFLVGGVFRVLERQVKEAAHLGGNLGVKAADDPAGSDGTRQSIGSKSARLAAKHIAGELVEQNQQRQGAFGALFPVGKLSGRRSFVSVKKPQPDAVIEAGVLVEPAVRSGLAPE